MEELIAGVFGANVGGIQRDENVAISPRGSHVPVDGSYMELYHPIGCTTLINIDIGCSMDAYPWDSR